MWSWKGKNCFPFSFVAFPARCLLRCGCRVTYRMKIQSGRFGKRAIRGIGLFIEPFSRIFGAFYWKTAIRRFCGLWKRRISGPRSLSVAKRLFYRTHGKGFFYAQQDALFFLRSRMSAPGRFFPLRIRVSAAAFSAFLLVFAVGSFPGRNPGLLLAGGKGETAASQNEESPQVASSPVGAAEESSGLYVDGRLVGAVKNASDLRLMLEKRLENARGGDRRVEARFPQNVKIVSSFFPASSVVSLEEMEKRISGMSRTSPVYEVQAGDTADSIAEAEELIRINGGEDENFIRPGALITLGAADPGLEVELVKTVVYEQTIPYSTVTRKDGSRYSDETKVVTQGTEGKRKCVDRVYSVNGKEIKREPVSREILKKPVSRTILAGTKKRPVKRPVNGKGIPSGKLMWPVPSCHTITSYFTWRRGTFHYGIDISGTGAYGKTIVAADGGTVVLAGWKSGYGKCVIISHGNGLKTLYGHCSRILAAAGQKVSKGEKIARIGSTGNSTGPHCHFEVIRNGRKSNPLLYVSR